MANIWHCYAMITLVILAHSVRRNMSALAAQNIFRSMPEKSYLNFLENGIPKPKKVADFLKLSQQEVAKATNLPKSSVRYDNRMPPELETRLMEIGNICELVANYFKGDAQKTALWFQIPNPLLGYISPKDMIRLGRYRKLMQFVINSISGDLP